MTVAVGRGEVDVRLELELEAELKEEVSVTLTTVIVIVVEKGSVPDDVEVVAEGKRMSGRSVTLSVIVMVVEIESVRSLEGSMTSYAETFQKVTRTRRSS